MRKRTRGNFALLRALKAVRWLNDANTPTKFHRGRNHVRGTTNGVTIFRFKVGE